MDVQIKEIKISRLIALSLAIVSAGFCLALFACSANSESILRSAVRADLDGIMRAEPAALEMLSEQLAVGDQFGIDPHAFASAWLDGFSYSIDGLSIEADSAMVEITISSRSIQAALESSMPDIEQLMAKVTETDDIDLVYEQCGQIVLRNLQSGQLTTDSLTLIYHLSGRSWVMDVRSSKELALSLASGA